MCHRRTGQTHAEGFPHCQGQSQWSVLLLRGMLGNTYPIVETLSGAAVGHRRKVNSNLSLALFPQLQSERPWECCRQGRRSAADVNKIPTWAGGGGWGRGRRREICRWGWLEKLGGFRVIQANTELGFVGKQPSIWDVCCSAQLHEWLQQAVTEPQFVSMNPFIMKKDESSRLLQHVWYSTKISPNI